MSTKKDLDRLPAYNTEEEYLNTIRRELRRYKLRTTVCTPSFMLSRRSPGLSIFMGWVIFVLWLTIVLFLFIAMAKVVQSNMLPQVAKVIVVGGLILGVFFSMVGVFVVDSLTSQEEKQTQMLDTLRRIEEHSYTQYQLTAKMVQRGYHG